MKDVSTDLLNLGVCYVCIDKPSVDVNIVSKAQEQQLSINPYAYIIKPTNAIAQTIHIKASAPKGRSKKVKQIAPKALAIKSKKYNR